MKGIAVFPFLVGLGYALWPVPGETARRRLARAGLVLLGFALPMGALAQYNRTTYGAVSGGPQATVNLAQQWIDREELYFTPDMAAQAPEVMAQVPRRLWLIQGVYNVWDYLALTPGVLRPAGVVLVLAWGVLAWRGIAKRVWPVCLTIAMLFVLCAGRAYPEARYLLPVVGFGCVLAGHAVAVAAARVNESRRVWLLGGVAGVGIVLLWWGYDPVVRARPDASYADVAAVVREDHGAGDAPVIMARVNQFAFFADGYHVGLPVGGPEAVAAAVRRWGVEYVVLDTRTIAVRRRELLPWYDAPPPWLHPLARVDAGRFPIVVYRVQPEQL